jgi:hypothetical protein
MFEDGVWRTVAGRRIFIKNGQSLTDAMKNSGKYKKNNLQERLKKQFKKSKIEYNLPEDNEKFSNRIKSNIDKLSNEYNTPLEKVGYTKAREVFKTGEAGHSIDFGKTIKIGQATEETIYHEFAHTIMSEDRYKYFNENKEFWDKVKKIEKDYYKEKRLIDKKSISSMKEYDPNFNRLEAMKKIEITPKNKYYETNTDEFFAESFAYAKLGLTNSPYAKQILEITDKYFKK